MTRAPIRVAAGQMVANDLAHADAALDAIERLAVAAAQSRAALLVLPECAYPAYYLQHYRSAILRSTPVLIERLAALAARHGLHLVCGLVEESDERLYNSAAVLDPAGRLLGMARKTFLWDCDNRWFSRGERISVFDTALGRIGVQICADARAPETTATLATLGAQLVAMPTAWVNVSTTPGELYNIQPDFLIEARAREFGVPFVCADKAGPEPPLHYVGQSLIVSAEGQVLRRGPVEGETLIVADVVIPQLAKVTVASATQRECLLDPVPPVVPPPVHRKVLLEAGRAGFKTGDARVARMAGADAMTFVAARCFARDGVQVLCVTDPPVDLAMLRARAAENRVFVLAVAGEDALLIGPEGGVRAKAAAADGVRVEVDIGEADIKRFTPETDIWAQRAVSCYAFE